jgi:colanic acid/amylovoran biosynthesis glycosyltransferase
MNTKLAYFIPIFPKVSHTFIEREIQNLRAQHVALEIFSNRKPKPDTYHHSDKHYIKEIVYVVSESIIQTILTKFPVFFWANLRCFIRNPRSYLIMAYKACDFKCQTVSEWFKNITLFFRAPFIGELCYKKRLTHIHFHFAFKHVIIGFFCKGLYNISYSISLHGTDAIVHGPLFDTILLHAAFIISNCHFHITNLKQKFPILRNQIFYIVRLGIMLEHHFWKPARISEDVTPLRILNIAQLNPVKAQHILIRACAVLRDNGYRITCRIIGNGICKNDLHKLIDSLDLSDTVCLLGQMDEKNVAQQLAWCHVSVLSSLSEGTPMSFIESMARARPLVGPNITAIPELIHHGKNGYLFKKGSYEDMADKLSFFCKNPETIEPMGKKSREVAEAMFDSEKNSLLLRTIFEKEVF